MTHILLLDGKLWMVNLPEKPDYTNYLVHENYRLAVIAYNHAYSLALEQKIEVENPDVVVGIFNSRSNEPIKWEGGCEIIYQYKPDKNSTHWTDCHISVWQEYSNHEMKQFGLARKVCRLIAPVKEEKKEPCPNCKETDAECACMRNKCRECGNPVGNITFTICDDCWDKKYPQEPVPSEQDNQEDAAVRFAMYMTSKTTAVDQDWFRICFKNGNWKKHNIDN